MASYDYTTPNSQLIANIGLQRHPEGGYFKETDRSKDTVPSPFADGQARPVMTTIYYLLTPEEPRGYFHRNKSETMHIHHQGRAEYTLLSSRPASIASGERWTPEITRRVMGTDQTGGELRQLFVGGDIWKMSRIPAEDLATAKSREDREKVGCLITEVVAPGFHWEDHDWMTMKVLRELFQGSPNAEEETMKYAGYIRPE
ncbi:hypothetical protein FRB94_002583 [Tulasnella sp. JGI-2019a]|nr:hypothetical protein FRB93_004931 [Tulasnella sp. JGI-2019a]KAG9004227.1 hypothetical protein FRB94_002583 [Tulasnella sp. JGI-2019a]KAG9031904.1 hypothetical protein FRB95_002110 [Tulasnella sp. JGI-2019a]